MKAVKRALRKVVGPWSPSHAILVGFLLLKTAWMEKWRRPPALLSQAEETRPSGQAGGLGHGRDGAVELPAAQDGGGRHHGLLAQLGALRRVLEAGPADSADGPHPGARFAGCGLAAPAYPSGSHRHLRLHAPSSHCHRCAPPCERLRACRADPVQGLYGCGFHTSTWVACCACRVGDFGHVLMLSKDRVGAKDATNCEKLRCDLLYIED